MDKDTDVLIPAGAEEYQETADPPVTGGRWFILAGDEVLYRRPNGEYVRHTVVKAVDLRSSPSWTRVNPAGA